MHGDPISCRRMRQLSGAPTLDEDGTPGGHPVVAGRKRPLSRQQLLASVSLLTMRSFRPTLLFLLLNVTAVWSLDKARTEARVDEAVATYGVTGKGVIYAMIDRGIDWQTNDFRNSDGTTRIAYIFDLTDDSGAESLDNPYQMGTIYTRDQIDAALKTASPLATRDAVGHGTANTGVAAGNGRNNPKYGGVAPNVVIIAVKIVAEDVPAHDGQAAEKAFYQAARVPVAIDFVRDKAKELGMPASVVLDIGSIGGPTDGSSTLVRKFDAFVGTARGLSLIVGTGDNGGVPNRAGGTVPAGGRVDLKVQKGVAGNLNFDLWYPGTDRYDVIVQSPNNSLWTVQVSGRRSVGLQTEPGRDLLLSLRRECRDKLGPSQWQT